MSLSLYDVTVPAFVNALEALDAFLAKGEAHTREKSTAPNELLEARLADDMLNLIQQVQRASDTAKGTVVRLSGAENPRFADDEKSFADLHARIRKTIDFVKSVPRAAFESAADRDIEMKLGGQSRVFKPLDYLVQFGLANFYFHITTAYDILRHRGVKIGKMDFLNIKAA